jgi:tRNA(Ile)-lysidine synthase
MTRAPDLVVRVLESCRTTGLLTGARRVLVAVSGGADSLALLHCLHRIRAALGVSLVAGHVDHGLRPDSASDAEFVASSCEHLGVACIVRRIRVPASPGGSLEGRARIARYEALRDVAREVGTDRTATGHTASDQAETLLFRLVRGTGPLGLSGIAFEREDGMVRPLLCATRDEVRAWVAREGIAFRDDPTNLDPRHSRNRLRMEVLPVLRGMNPRIDFALSRLAEESADLGEWIRESVAPLARHEEVGVVRIARTDWEELPAALRPYAVVEAWRSLTGSPLGLSRTHLRAVLGMAASGAGTVSLPGQVRAGSTRDWLVFETLRPVTSGSGFTSAGPLNRLRH